ncbi:hypothetical protein [Candidatus Binatus sp.]
MNCAETTIPGAAHIRCSLCHNLGWR